MHAGRLNPGKLLSTPYSRRQLASKVTQVLGNSDAKATKAVQATPIGDARVSPGDGYGPRILVVDDDVASLDGT